VVGHRNGVRESCLQCGSDQYGNHTSCFVCDSTNDGTLDTCNQPCNIGGIPVCHQCDNDGNGFNDDCTHLCVPLDTYKCYDCVKGAGNIKNGCYIPLDEEWQLDGCQHFIQVSPPYVGVNGCSAPFPFGDNPCGHSATSFNDCCNDHDICYGTCGSDKSACDVVLRECAFDVCDAAGPVSCPNGGFDCSAYALAYYTAVRDRGQSYYNDAQYDKCDCCW